jgi:sugar/nucleoside kinase (ribokinase family)
VSTKHLSAIVAGHICLDIYPNLSGYTNEQFQKSFVPGHLLNVGPLSFATGGAVSNTGLALHTLGVGTRLMGKIGEDYLGKVVKEIIQRFSPILVEGMVEDPEVSTSYTIVISPPGIDRYLIHCPGANDAFSSNDVRTKLLKEVRLFHFGYPPLMKLMYSPDGHELTRIFQEAKTTGVTTSLDTAFSDPESPAGQANWPAILEATLPYVDIFMPSIEEILLMLHRQQYEELMRRSKTGDILPLITPDLLTSLSCELLEMGALIVGLKLGNRGLYIHTSNRDSLNKMGRGGPSDLNSWADQELWSPCYEVTVAGTAGAGDATIAGFLSAVLRDYSPIQAINSAVAVGACNVEKIDTLSGIKSWEETIGRVNKGWSKKQLELSSDGWLYDPIQQIWARS